MTTSIQTIKARTNRELAKLTAGYLPEIPLSDIFSVIRERTGAGVVQEDGTPWSGFICGESGSCSLTIQGFRFSFRMTWFQMPSGKYEVTAYVS